RRGRHHGRSTLTARGDRGGGGTRRTAGKRRSVTKRPAQAGLFLANQVVRLGQLPVVPVQEWNRGPVAQDRIYLHFGAADHEIRMHGGDVDAVDHAAFDRFGVGAAVRDVARGVLVVERVEEDEARLADA